MVRALLAALALGSAAPVAAAAAPASGRHWQLVLENIDCAAPQAQLALGMRIRYAGPKGPVEAPVIRLVDAAGKPLPPKSLVWQRGSRELAQWLSAGGVAMVAAEDVGTFQFRFDLRGAAGELRLEFGDIRAFALTRKGARDGCQGVLQAGEIEAPRARRASAAPAAGPLIRVFRGIYPCRPREGGLRPMEANHPPYLPRQVLLFGRGYLPNARHIDLPQGKAAAQAYVHAGLATAEAMEQAARKALAQDFPDLASGLLAQGGADARFFAFDWGTERSPSGNELHAIGVYDLRRCGR